MELLIVKQERGRFRWKSQREVSIQDDYPVAYSTYEFRQCDGCFKYQQMPWRQVLSNRLSNCQSAAIG